jgi:hypothetical protein
MFKTRDNSLLCGVMALLSSMFFIKPSGRLGIAAAQAHKDSPTAATQRLPFAQPLKPLPATKSSGAPKDDRSFG